MRWGGERMKCVWRVRGFEEYPLGGIGWKARAVVAF